MEKETYKITLADGTCLEGLTKSGTNYISDTQVDESIFTGNCAPMTFTCSDGTEETYENGEFIQQATYNGVSGYYLAFRDKPVNAAEQQITNLQVALCEVYELLAAASGSSTSE